MSTNRGFEKECKHFYAKLSEKIAENDGHYRRSSSLGKAKDRVQTNQFDYFMYKRKQNSCQQQEIYDKINI